MFKALVSGLKVYDVWLRGLLIWGFKLRRLGRVGDEKLSLATLCGAANSHCHAMCKDDTVR